MPKFKVEIDKDGCIGCAACNAVYPDNFEMGDDGKAKVLKPEVTDIGKNQEAADSCPVQVIKITKLA